MRTMVDEMNPEILTQPINLEQLKNMITSNTDVQKNFKSVRNKTKQNGEVIVFKNNEPDLVIMDIKKYDKTNKTIAELQHKINRLEEILEHTEVYQTLLARKDADKKHITLAELAEAMGIELK